MADNQIIQTIKSECRSKSVFTESQIEQIIQICVVLQDGLVSIINEIKQNNNIKALESRMERLVTFSEKNTEVLLSLQKQVKCLEVREMHDERVDNLMKEIRTVALKRDLEELLHRIAALECKDYKDNRIEEVLKRFALLEAKELKDCRVEAIIREIESNRRLNLEQTKAIHLLSEENAKQAKDILALNELLRRNSLALSTEIQSVEKHIAADDRVDITQNAEIIALRRDIVELKNQLDRITNTLLVKK